MLEVTQLTRRYGDAIAVENVSFTIQKSEIVGLLGHNGAGKTTIMKMLSGFLEPNQGSVTVDSLNLADHTKQIQYSLGYLPENLPIYPEMSVADYLDYAADLKGLKNDNKQVEIKRVVTATDIGSKLSSSISTLSRGYKQRVGVAQAILGRPKLLILDEPTNGLDPEQTQHMRQLIRDIAKEATVILSTHIMQEVDALCSRVLILRAGQLAVDAQLDELRRSQHWHISSSISSADIEPLKKVAGIKDITPLNTETQNGTPAYQLTLTQEADQHSTCATIAKAIIEAGYELYQLQPIHRDLETLFREVTEQAYQQKGLSDAA